jgi:hypothetical protein
MSSLLQGANSWIAFNVSTKDIPILTTLGVHAGIKRVVFTTELDNSRIDETVIPGFDDAVKAFELAGSSFTGVRHGVIIGTYCWAVLSILYYLYDDSLMPLAGLHF